MDANNNPSRIVLVGDNYRHEEAYAQAALTPGHLVELTATGKVQKHSVAGGPAECLFAIEDALQGRGINTAYAANELVSLAIPRKGDVVYVWLSGGESADPSEYLTSNGDGTFKVASSTDIRLLKPLETVDASDSNDVDERIKARVL